MDPTAAWNDLSEAVGEADWERAAEVADGLLHWLNSGGSEPKITGKPVFDRLVAKATCEAIAAWDVAV